MLEHVYIKGLADAFTKFAVDLDTIDPTDLVTYALSAKRGIQGAYDLGAHGPWGDKGKSHPEETAEKDLKKAKGSDQKLEAAKKHHEAVRDAENAGVGLTGLGTALVGGLGQRLLGRSVIKGEQGQHTTMRDLNRLEKAIIPGTESVNVLTNEPFRNSFHIPKGGIAPKFMNPLERKVHTSRGIKPDVIDLGLNHGVQVITSKAGPHQAAHEMGHNWFTKTTGGKALNALRYPAPAAAGIAAGYMASDTDPDSTAAKLAPLVGALGVLPALGEEAAASLKGYSAMKKLRYNPQQLSTARSQLLKAFGSYGLGMGTAAIGAPIAIRAIRKYLINRRAEHKLPQSSDTQKKVDKLEAKRPKSPDQS